MLKRTLTILVLTILAVILMGSGPVGSPSAVPPEGELEVEVGDKLVVFLWGTTGTPLTNVAPVMRQIETPPSEVQEVYDSLSDETLAQLPQRIRDRITGESQVAYNHHDYDCELLVNRPWRSGSNVRAYGFWDCRAEQRTSKTYLRLTLWQDIDTRLDASGGEWQSTRTQSRSVVGPCASGKHAYYARSRAGVEFQNGARRFASKDRGPSFITC